MKKSLIASIFLITSFNSFSQDLKLKNEIIENIKTNNPDLVSIDGVKETSVPGVFEIIINKNEIFYSTKDGKTFFLGDMVQVTKKGRESLTENRIDELNKFSFSDLDFKNAIKIGNGKNVIVTFEDPNCPYCRKLHEDLKTIKDLTVYTFITPVLGQKSLEVAYYIWCSKNREKEWENYMNNGMYSSNSNHSNKNCNVDSITTNLNFAKKFKIKGTPTILFKNGKMFKGYVDAATIKSNF